MEPPVPSVARSARRPRADGRRLRSARTKAALIEAFIELVQKTSTIPTAAQIAKHAGLSTRSFFERLVDFNSLFEEAFDFLLSQGLPTPASNTPSNDRHVRIDYQVRVRAITCERWLPLWRAMTRARGDTRQVLQPKLEIARQMAITQLELVYRLELSSLRDKQRQATLVALEALTDYETWGRMREQRKLSFDAACEIWKSMIDRILPPAQ